MEAVDTISVPDRRITVARLAVTLAAREPARLPYYKGSAIRGGFGLAFRRVACPYPRRECANCLLRQQCVWSYVFATPRPEDSTIMRKYETIPHPFVIEPPDDDKTEYGTGEELGFTLVLVGRAIDAVPYFIYTFEQMAEQGLGAGRARFEVRGIAQDGQVFYDGHAKSILSPVKSVTLTFDGDREAARTARVRFRTPVRMTFEGRMARRPQFHVLFRSLLRRIGLLAYFHDQPMEIDYKGLIRRAETIVTTRASFATMQWRRYSTRQARAIEMQGVMGSATYEGDLEPFIPWLRVGEVLHVGKGTAFGMGKYEMEVK